ncbi:hypothetical protein MMC14_003874 [Varicellaria rhodocarpa]|nr:hypothetical protein [Varicellaria rhodocarpa]
MDQYQPEDQNREPNNLYDAIATMFRNEKLIGHCVQQWKSSVQSGNARDIVAEEVRAKKLKRRYMQYWRTERAVLSKTSDAQEFGDNGMTGLSFQR